MCLLGCAEDIRLRLAGKEAEDECEVRCWLNETLFLEVSCPLDQ